jgi:hypothetical protein
MVPHVPLSRQIWPFASFIKIVKERMPQEAVLKFEFAGGRFRRPYMLLRVMGASSPAVKVIYRRWRDDYVVKYLLDAKSKVVIPGGKEHDLAYWKIATYLEEMNAR